MFSLVCNYLRPSNNSRQLIFNINDVVLIVIICKDLRKWLNVYLNLSIFTALSKVKDYAALNKPSIALLSKLGRRNAVFD